MSTTEHVFNGDVARAARALVQVNPLYIAAEAEISRQQLRDFEKGLGELNDAEAQRLQRVLEDLGAVFLPDGAGEGYGVRRKFSREKSRQLDNWEGEGGPVGEDD